VDPALEFVGITKTFPGVLANDDINLAFLRGEVHCLLGENGAGKTTLMNIAFGLYHPDRGQILVNGQPVVMTNPSVAIANGIGMVHQHFMLVEPLSVAENVVIGQEPPSRLVFPKEQAVREVANLSERYGLTVDPRAVIENLPLGIRQRVEILKVLYRKANILILDEPTAVLAAPEVEELYKVIESLRAAGKTVIFITHKLKETMAVSDRITVLRDGRVMGTAAREETSPEQLARMMVGRDVVLRVSKAFREPGDVVLQVENLEVDDARSLPALRGITFQVRRGQIYGIAGIEGNGQSELIEAITGLRPVRSGEILLERRPITGMSPAEILDEGIGHVPEDRLRRGLIGRFSVAENLILGYHHQDAYRKTGVLALGQIDAHASELISRYDIRTPAPSTPVRSLSGGNQQKTVLARALSSQPKVLVVAQPTRGLDVGATEYVHNQLLQMRDQGVAILLVSADLDEVRRLSDRIGVLFQGELMAEKQASEFSEEELGLLMSGSRPNETSLGNEEYV
jgi:simple sugar transport system ATP-binding protein